MRQARIASTIIRAVVYTLILTLLLFINASLFDRTELLTVIEFLVLFLLIELGGEKYEANKRSDTTTPSA